MSTAREEKIHERPVLTSSILIADVGKPPDIAKSNSVGHAGHDEVEPANPVATSNALIAAQTRTGAAV